MSLVLLAAEDCIYDNITFIDYCVQLHFQFPKCLLLM